MPGAESTSHPPWASPPGPRLGILNIQQMLAPGDTWRLRPPSKWDHLRQRSEKTPVGTEAVRSATWLALEVIHEWAVAFQGAKFCSGIKTWQHFCCTGNGREERGPLAGYSLRGSSRSRRVSAQLTRGERSPCCMKSSVASPSPVGSPPRRSGRWSCELGTETAPRPRGWSALHIPEWEASGLKMGRAGAVL